MNHTMDPPTIVYVRCKAMFARLACGDYSRSSQSPRTQEILQNGLQYEWWKLWFCILWGLFGKIYFEVFEFNKIYSFANYYYIYIAFSEYLKFYFWLPFSKSRNEKVLTFSRLHLSLGMICSDTVIYLYDHISPKIL
jgi:hypothetical protein